ncbi:alpha/beta hydrolase [Rivularia sp. UHCC 0363]|uniref:alpha/beta fold hydrolase n=1 Tax=Rivularia sp. UHCC 0363 TaxID=3110244 RepID=UPI002B21BE06|nr:alpha/beta hydrolase [Rivularia sp. UHCC 0363]MEA5596910.1 alpha/beta hydrolase [Rivularia sp. UHCC 0363]
MHESLSKINTSKLKDFNALKLFQNIQTIPINTPLYPQPISTAYVHQGNNNIPILLLHGFESSLLEFRLLIPLLAAKNETWAVDLLGFGFTQRIKNINYCPDTIKTHLYHFWKTQIDRPVILVGASMGGAAAIDFTVSYPNCVHQLVLINSVGYSGSFPQGRFLFPPFDYLAVEYWRQRKLQALFFGDFGNLSDAEMTSLQCAALHLDMPNWHEATISFTKSGGYSEIAPRIKEISKPTLILWGEKDETLGTQDADKFKRAIAQSRLIWLRCGHTPQLEQPEQVAEWIFSNITKPNVK